MGHSCSAAQVLSNSLGGFACVGQVTVNRSCSLTQVTASPLTSRAGAGGLREQGMVWGAKKLLPGFAPPLLLKSP